MTNPNRLKYALIAPPIILFIWMMYRGCHNARTRLAETNRMRQVTDSLKERLRASQIAIANIRSQSNAKMAAAAREKTLAARRADSAGKLLTATQARVKRLLSERIGVMEGPMDEEGQTYFSEGKPVFRLIDDVNGKRFIRNCDSCWAVLPVLDAQVTGYREENEQLKALTDYEIKIRDEAIAAERRHSDTLQKRADILSSFKIPKPRNKIYFTLTALTDLTGFGYGGGFTLVTKTDKIWSLKTGVLNRQLFYQCDFGTLLSAKRK